jgi:D-sedoheptulose 7-phosphate isomerase
MTGRENFFPSYFTDLADKIVNVDCSALLATVSILQEISRKGGKIILAGNGGSAAIASHVSVDLTKSARLRAVNFNEADLITCFANDYGYEHWIEKALVFYADPNDALVLISSSGKSQNILNGALRAREMGLKLITMSGFNSDNPLRQLGDINFWCNSKAYNIVEMTHQIWLLALVDYLGKQDLHE